MAVMTDPAGSVEVGTSNDLRMPPDTASGQELSKHPKSEFDSIPNAGSLPSLEPTTYTTSELDTESNDGITIVEPPVEEAAVAIVSLPPNHFGDLSVDQIKSSSLLVATESDPESGKNITHVYQPEVSPVSTTSNSNANINSNGNPTSQSSEQGEHPIISPIPRPHRTIRFRSRVRITSGVGKNHVRHARRSSSDGGPVSDIAASRAHLRSLASLSPDWGGILSSGAGSPGDSTVSLTTSRSSSISSSISAPIRFREDESPSSGRPSKWGPLGRRVQLFVGQQKAAKQQKPQPGNGQGKGKKVMLVYDPNTRSYVPSPQAIAQEAGGPEMHSEVSPLLGGGHRSYRARRLSNSSNSSGAGSYDSHDGRYDNENDWGPDSYESRLNQEIDKVFGTWPGRLLNRHWWWWHLEPILCCRYMEESDFED